MAKRIPAIVQLVAHNDGPAALSARLRGFPVQQEISRWLKRGWAAPCHLFRLEKFMPEGMTVRDLDTDRTRARSRAAKAA